MMENRCIQEQVFMIKDFGLKARSSCGAFGVRNELEAGIFARHFSVKPEGQ
jgi:hypothetical protein